LSPDLKGGLSIEGVKRLKKQWVYNLNSRKANQNKYKKREEKREKKSIIYAPRPTEPGFLSRPRAEHRSF